MDRKLLFKSNIMGNTAMRKNRAAKANSDRNFKRKELFTQGRDISVSPDTDQKTSLSAARKNAHKKSEEVAKKEEAYQARFMVYMQEKRQRLAQERASKKPPFISAVGGQSTHKVAQKSFEFVAPKPVKDKSKGYKFADCKTAAKNSNRKIEIKPARATRNARTKPETVMKKNDSLRPGNAKITRPAETKEKSSNQLGVHEQIQKETPLMKDKVFVFNNVGPVLTSTARKHSLDNNGYVVGDPESIFSPIEGIAPLEATIVDDNVIEKKEEPLVSEPSELPIRLVDAPKQESPEEKKTPTRPNNGETEHFYLSPFVTTSRGKVSAKKERRNRDSVYKLELNRSVEEPVEVRRRREAIKYFRKILDDEAKRLNEECSSWITYMEKNEDSMEEQGIDMINVATGQTKLLISGKMKQFIKLVEDCEQFANQFKVSDNLLRVQNDISPEDLEGYWNIVKLQIENVDHRFETLAAWRDNNWKDPDEKPRQKRNLLLAKSMKPKKKIKAKEGVKSLIMKARKEYLKNKISNNQGCDQDIVFVSRRSQRKSHNQVTPAKSPARRIIIKTPYRTSIAFKENLTPNIRTPAQKRMSAVMKASGSGIRYNRRLSETPKASTSKKSILKSEAKKTLKKSVLFSEMVQYKSPEPQQLKLSRNRSISECEASPRIMELRTRKLLMKNDISDFL